MAGPEAAAPAAARGQGSGTRPGPARPILTKQSVRKNIISPGWQQVRLRGGSACQHVKPFKSFIFPFAAAKPCPKTPERAPPRPTTPHHASSYGGISPDKRRLLRAASSFVGRSPTQRMSGCGWMARNLGCPGYTFMSHRMLLEVRRKLSKYAVEIDSADNI